jgi:hypothetical protein
MATPQDADLIMKLYDLRREETMRKARSFVIMQFFPKSMEEIKAMFFDRRHPEYNAYFRQVTTYWDMAAAMVNHGTIDRDLFYQTNGELFAVWAKVQDYTAELREFLGPMFLVNLEKLIASYPDGEARCQAVKARLNRMAEQYAALDK